MDIVQVLIIIGIIVFAVVKQLISSSEKEEQQRQAAPKRVPVEDQEVSDRKFHETTESLFSYDYDYSPDPPKAATPEPPASPPTLEEPENNPDFNIHSIEEARRAIIWSEILNRKY